MAKKMTPTEEKKVRQTKFIQLVRGVPGQILPVSIRVACDEVNISRQTYRHWKTRDADFIEIWEDAFADGTDLIEDEATRRAVNGVSEPVYQGGELVGHKQVYSDRLMELILMGRRPERYSKNPQLAVQVNNNIVEASDEQLARALALLMAETRAKQTMSLPNGINIGHG